MQSTTRLLQLAKIWATTNERSLPRLATIVANDGKLFDRISSGGSCTMATFDRFLLFFSEAGNWKNGIPDSARELLIERAAA